jgi:hypothetical protein
VYCRAVLRTEGWINGLTHVGVFGEWGRWLILHIKIDIYYHLLNIIVLFVLETGTVIRTAISVSIALISFKVVVTYHAFVVVLAGRDRASPD